jgi:hypothetical protein
MNERLRLVEGLFEVNSRLGKGIEIVVGVAEEGDLLDVCLAQCLKGEGINPS